MLPQKDFFWSSPHVREFQMYVYGKDFVVLSDHKPLEIIYLKNLLAAPTSLQPMLLRLNGYQVQITYKPNVIGRRDVI